MHEHSCTLWLHAWQNELYEPVIEYPSCLHTTVASVTPHESSQTVPHSLLMQISILPSFGTLPPASRMSPVEHGASHPTPASSLWSQLLVRIGLLGHSRSWLLLEEHWTSSKYMGPLPEPKKALLYGVPATEFRGGKIIIEKHNYMHIILVYL